MKDNCGYNQQFKSTRRWFASLSHRGFVRAGILGCILILLTTPLLAQTIASNNPCKESNDNQRCGVLKGCKVAGFGVPVGTPFTFAYSSTPSYVSGTATILAGPAPGGLCKHSGSLPIGTTVTITETPIPPGDAVSNIIVTPATRLVSMNLVTGTVTVKIGTGVTEVTYTDHSLKGGYLEICKQGLAGTAPLSGIFNFTVNPGNIPIAVPAGYCSPPIEVPAGTLTITETPVSGIQLAACTAYPASIGPCQVTGPWTVKVNVVPGVLSSQTIVTIIDKKAGPQAK
jgi:hypothetical protein